MAFSFGKITTQNLKVDFQVIFKINYRKPESLYMYFVFFLANIVSGGAMKQARLS
jgi:hypothetical protein